MMKTNLFILLLFILIIGGFAQAVSDGVPLGIHQDNRAQMRLDFQQAQNQVSFGSSFNWAGMTFYKMESGIRYLDSQGNLQKIPGSLNKPNFTAMAKSNPEIAKALKESSYNFEALAISRLSERPKTSERHKKKVPDVNAKAAAPIVIRDGAFSGGYYAYAPNVVDLESHVIFFSCHGPTGRPNQIEDQIFLDQGTTSSQVFARGNSESWDSNQVCDPSVVKGNFKYNGQSYSYALFYTSASIADNQAGLNNQLGVAFTNNLTSSNWVRYSKPVIGFQSPEKTTWGVGQPSAIKLSGDNGRVLLFYARGDLGAFGTFYLNIDLSDISDTNPPILESTATMLNNSGLTDLRGDPDKFTNIDVAYDPQVDRYYVIREKHYNMKSGKLFPPVSEVGGQGNIVNALELVSISGSDFAKNGQWTVEGKIDSADSGNFLNHNSGLRRNVSGNIPQSGTVEVYYTSGCKVSDGVSACDAWDKWFYHGSIQSKYFTVGKK